jgi:ATP-dependent RNA helicase DeaD
MRTGGSRTQGPLSADDMAGMPAIQPRTFPLYARSRPKDSGAAVARRPGRRGEKGAAHGTGAMRPLWEVKMTDIDIAAPLAAALAAKGYATLTPVQQAVLADGMAGRDLLVSAQTGSGKTVAFGIAIAPEILAGSDRLLFADVPLGLCVAPTRELALQVARELEWLYADAGAKIVTCVGGMDYRTEKRALDRGAHIVVGTPGRLRDHIERKSLDLSALQAAVLDEADEMLDLGFREDLEFILNAAPDTRRTLMFSATVPKAIAELAKDFQRDAIRLQTAGEARQHVDIEYKVMSVAVRDRDHAIFNALRFYDARSAIVFCKTRANVNNLLARMGNRGFQVVALSGELSQQERTHALQALRDGRARVCIATDVAARGIDLPGLDLVIHADLPSNSEILLHRSGRTGRAGSKGVSALIVVPAEFKKAQRLLQGAKVVAEWGSAPGADDVQGRDDLRLMDHPTLMAGVGDEAAMADALLGKFGPESVAAAFIRLWREGRSAPEVLQDQAVPAQSAPRERGEFGESVWFELSVGRSGRAEARWLLPKICEAGGIAKDGIGAIRVQEDRTFVQIGKAVAARFGATLELEAGLVMTLIEGEPNLDRPERSPRPAFDKPERRAPAPRAAAPRPVRDDVERAPKPEYRAKPPRIVEEDTPASPPRDVEPAMAAVTERKPYVKRDDPKPFTPRAAGEKPYAKRDDGDRKPYAAKPYAPKPYAKREDGAKPYAAKPYAKREDGDRKPYAPAGAKPYAPRAEGAKPYAPRAEGAKPYAPRAKAEGGKSAGFKSHGGGADKPGKSAGFKSHATDAKPYRPKADGAEGKPYRAKPAGDGKPFKPRVAGAKPAAKVDARDTSKRFVPPRKSK